MKNTAKVFGIAVVITAIVFSIVFTFPAYAAEKGSQWITFSSVRELEIYLSKQPANKPKIPYKINPYKIKLNIGDEDIGQDEDLNRLLRRTDKYIILDLSDSVITHFGLGAFRGCVSLTGIILPTSLKVIEYEAFGECANLINITIPKGVIEIEAFAFYECTSLVEINVDSDNSEYISENGILYSKDKTFLHTYPAGKTERSFTVPDNVITICFGAFSCSVLNNVIIGNNVESIGGSAFRGCTNLTELNIPDSVTKIWDAVFSDCTSLTGVTISNNVTEIDASSFQNCTSLTDVKIPNSVTCIDTNAFYGCISLKSIIIPKSVTSIGSGAFYKCTGLTSIIIPKNVTIIEEYAFDGCTNLTSVTFEGNTIIWHKGVHELTRETFEGSTIIYYNAFLGNLAYLGCLHEKSFYETYKLDEGYPFCEEEEDGTPGTYTTTAPVGENSIWTKQP
jgi:hypothetical protein